MTHQKDWQPCFECPLDDCDDSSVRCAYRIALNDYQRAQRKGQTVTDEMRVHYSIARAELNKQGYVENDCLFCHRPVPTIDTRQKFCCRSCRDKYSWQIRKHRSPSRTKANA